MVISGRIPVLLIGEQLLKRLLLSGRLGENDVEAGQAQRLGRLAHVELRSAPVDGHFP